MALDDPSLSRMICRAAFSLGRMLRIKKRLRTSKKKRKKGGMDAKRGEREIKERERYEYKGVAKGNF